MTRANFSINLNPKDHHEISLSWKDITALTIPRKQNKLYSCFKTQPKETPKQILTNVSGFAKPGELLAIMGSSGAGKTTLLNILTMRSKGKLSLSGEIHINNKVATSKMLAATAAYIEQDSLFIGTLTVKEQLIFHARLRMGNSTYAEKLQRVDEVLQELGLTKCQHNLIGIAGRIKGISGGEKRRLAVACEILTNPYLLFCDEPTTGLDSSMARTVVTILRNMALKGKTVLCTIHQPSSEIYALFDKILFLAEGRVAYLGTRDGALEYFTSLNYTCPVNYNPADYFIRTLAVTSNDKIHIISEICDSFEKSDRYKQIKDEIDFTTNNEKLELPDEALKSSYKVPWSEQLKAVLWRSCLSVFKEPILIKMRLLQNLVLGLFIGFFYYRQDISQLSINNLNGAMYILLINCTYQNMYSVIHVNTSHFEAANILPFTNAERILVFCLELPIFLRDHASGLYGSAVYFFSKVFADQVIFIIGPFLFTTSSYWLVGFLPNFTNFLLALLVYTLVANAATSLGYLLSTITSSAPMAITFGSACVVPLMLFGGYFIRKLSVPWYLVWIPYLSWFEYGFECLTINQWKDVQYIKCNVANNTCPKNGLEVLRGLDFAPSAFWPNILSLLAFIIIIRLAALTIVSIRAQKASRV